MPTYEYVCKSCGHLFEIVQSMRDDPLRECPECGGELRKIFAPPAISFKGSGFYATDHGRKGPPKQPSGEKADKSEKAGNGAGKTDAGASKEGSKSPAGAKEGSSSGSSGTSGSTGGSSEGGGS
ncbi:MAG TPA: FmdB family zinc ribbon protein [Actinomycetota bacterium]|nr:FmdB family zinc ribbon protein [Actinomycetota bacterium]